MASWCECRGTGSGQELIALHLVDPASVDEGHGKLRTLCGVHISSAFIAEGRRRYEAAKCNKCEATVKDK